MVPGVARLGQCQRLQQRCTCPEKHLQFPFELREAVSDGSLTTLTEVAKTEEVHLEKRRPQRRNWN